MLDFLHKLWDDYKSWRYERRCIKYLGVKPTKLYVSKEDYDALVKAINFDANPEVQKSIQKLLERKSPWNND